MSKFTFSSFQDCCRRCVAAAPACATWVLSFREGDFERDWFVTARVETFEASVHVASAGATVTMVPDVIAGLGKLLEELATGVVDASAKRRAILAELVAAGLC